MLGLILMTQKACLIAVPIDPLDILRLCHSFQAMQNYWDHPIAKLSIFAHAWPRHKHLQLFETHAQSAPAAH